MTNDNSSQEKVLLEHHLDRLHAAMLVAVLIVVLGLIVEDLFDFIPGTADWLIGIARRTGEAMVALGVAAELVIEFMRGGRDNRLRDINEAALIEGRERAARAEIQAAELTASLERSKLPRMVVFSSVMNKFVNILKSQPAGKAECMYQAEDAEAMMFALTLAAALRVASWDLKATVPTPPSPFPGMPSVIAAGGQASGLAILTRDIFDEHPASTLHNALRECEVFTTGWRTSPEIPEGLVRIVISQKP
jgi:hypothetical protein